MEPTHKNIVLGLILVCLCFMIKCKLDSDSREHTSAPASEQMAKEKSSSKVHHKSTTDTGIDSIPSANTQSGHIDSSHVLSTRDNPSHIKTTADSSTASPDTGTKQSIEQKKTPKKSKKKTGSAAKIEFEELSWDFGEITEGDIVSKNFIFQNTGDRPLQIIGATASCGCTRPTVPFLDIAPGEKSQIGVTYNSVNKEGEQHPEIIIESNTVPRHTIIQLSGTVTAKSSKKDSTTSIKKDTTDSKMK